jgi:hypothetical protein
MITKKCPYCGLIKTLENFKKDNRRSDGRATECKSCHNKKYSEYNKRTRPIHWSRLYNWRCKNREHVNKQALGYQQTPQGKIRKSARDKVYNAIKTGKLLKQPCEVCGKSLEIAKTAHAHHEDYNKPLEVIWLCRTHHAERHHNKIL